MVRVININKGKNEDIVNESKALSDYIFFTDRIRYNIENGFLMAAAIDEAVKFCIESQILEDFLKQYQAEVVNMLTTEFDLEKALQAMRLDGIEKGIEKGIEENVRKVVGEMLKKNYDDNEIMDIMGISADKLMYFKGFSNH